MFQFVYNSYFFEWCHNSWIIVQSKLWNTNTSTSTTSPVLAITYPDSKSNNDNTNTNTNNNSTMKEPDNKLHDILLDDSQEEREVVDNYENENENENSKLTNFYYLALFRESRTTWSIHGLWPQTDVHNYPTYCKKVEFDADKLAPILDKLEQYWYSEGHTLILDEKFWKHEWEKHGSCVYTNMTEFEYFKNTIELYELALELYLPEQFYDKSSQTCLIPVNQKLQFITPDNQV